MPQQGAGPAHALGDDSIDEGRVEVLFALRGDALHESSP
jgi:hypothetical protein